MPNAPPLMGADNCMPPAMFTMPPPRFGMPGYGPPSTGPMPDPNQANGEPAQPSSQIK